MNKKDFELIARILKIAKDNAILNDTTENFKVVAGINKTISIFANELSSKYPKFKKDLFIKIISTDIEVVKTGTFWRGIEYKRISK